MIQRTEEDDFLAYASDGDIGALGRVFDATSCELLRIAVHLTGELGDAEDVVQETYLAAMQSARKFRGGNLRAWLVRILQHRARRVRTHRGREHPSRDLRTRPVSETGIDPVVERSSQAEDAARLRAVIDQQPEPYRTVLGLHARHGLGVREIAETLDRPQNTVRSQLDRGVARLRQALPVVSVLGGAALVSASGLAAMRKRVLDSGAQIAKGPVGLATVTKVVIGAVALVIAGLAVFVMGRPHAGDSTYLRKTGAAELRVETNNEAGAGGARRAIRSTRIATAAKENPVRIRVVDARTGAAVPGAEVLYHDTHFRQVDLTPEGI